MAEMQVTLVKQYVDRFKKSMTYEKLLTVFPSVNFQISGRMDLKAIINNNSPYVSGVTVPISFASKFITQIDGLSEDVKNNFYSTKAVITDFETESWLKANKNNSKRKRAFSNIPSLPQGWEKLFVIPAKDDEHMSFGTMKKRYLERLKTFFGNNEQDDSIVIGLVTNCMSYAAKELLSVIPLPPAPVVVGDDSSLYYCLKVNEVYNKFKDHFELFKVVYYPLHISVLEKNPQVMRKILAQIYNLKPDFIIFSTNESHLFLFPQNKYNSKKTNFNWLVDELALYSKANNAVVGWYDKGDFSSSYGLKLIKNGFDFFIYPLKGHSREGGGGGKGPQYGYTLDEFAYYSWDKYLARGDQHYINSKTPEQLHALAPHQQWEYKRTLEIRTRVMQFDHIHTKLELEASLDGFEVRLKQNKID